MLPFHNMIFSKTTCPLCGHKLQFREEYLSEIPYIFYFCPVKESTRNLANTGIDYLSHFDTYSYNIKDEFSKMITPEYIMIHTKSLNLTCIYINSPYDAIRRATEVPLLSHINYGDSEQLKNKIKMLILFS